MLTVEIVSSMGGPNVLVVKNNGKTILSEIDGGEPEDNSFYRNYKWVKRIILMAYTLGKIDGELREEMDARG